jgi:hypothetical protein
MKIKVFKEGTLQLIEVEMDISKEDYTFWKQHIFRAIYSEVMTPIDFAYITERHFPRLPEEQRHQLAMKYAY